MKTNKIQLLYGTVVAEENKPYLGRWTDGFAPSEQLPNTLGDLFDIEIDCTEEEFRQTYIGQTFYKLKGRLNFDSVCELVRCELSWNVLRNVIRGYEYSPVTKDGKPIPVNLHATTPEQFRQEEGHSLKILTDYLLPLDWTVREFVSEYWANEDVGGFQ